MINVLSISANLQKRFLLSLIFLVVGFIQLSFSQPLTKYLLLALLKNLLVFLLKLVKLAI
jgi:hypothetical protein